MSNQRGGRCPGFTVPVRVFRHAWSPHSDQEVVTVVSDDPDFDKIGCRLGGKSRRPMIRFGPDLFVFDWQDLIEAAKGGRVLFHNPDLPTDSQVECKDTLAAIHEAEQIRRRIVDRAERHALPENDDDITRLRQLEKQHGI